jgi:hypothetical protein
VSPLHFISLSLADAHHFTSPADAGEVGAPELVEGAPGEGDARYRVEGCDYSGLAPLSATQARIERRYRSGISIPSISSMANSPTALCSWTGARNILFRIHRT